MKSCYLGESYCWIGGDAWEPSTASPDGRAHRIGQLEEIGTEMEHNLQD